MSTQASTSGPPGHPRGIAFAILLAIVTLGMGIFVWFIKVQGALNRYWESKSTSTVPVAS